MSNIKSKIVREQVEARIKALVCWPCPTAAIDALVARVDSKVADIVSTVIANPATVGARYPEAFAEVQAAPSPGR